MVLSDPRRADTTTKLPVQAPREYAPSAADQTIDVVLRYATPSARGHARTCLDLFVSLANAGFFAVSGRPGPHPAAELAHTSEGREVGGVPMDAWALTLRSVGARGLQWIIGALKEAGAHVEHCSVVVPETMGGGQSGSAPAHGYRFGVLTKRPVSGYYVQLSLFEPADEEQEASFRTLIRLWTAFALGLPSRDGRARSSVTTMPSFERGGYLLGAAGRELDVLRGDAELALLTALAQFDREIAPIHDVMVQLA